jgi:hypothetical protein
MMIANGEVGDRGDISTLPIHAQSPEDAHLYNLPGDDADNNAGTRHAARMNVHWPAEDGWHLTPDCSEDCEGDFSWHSCDACGSTLGGDRHAAIASRRVES